MSNLSTKAKTGAGVKCRVVRCSVDAVSSRQPQSGQVAGRLATRARQFAHANVGATCAGRPAYGSELRPEVPNGVYYVCCAT